MKTSDKLFIIISIFIMITIPYFTNANIKNHDPVEEKTFLSYDEMYKELQNDGKSETKIKSLIGTKKKSKENNLSFAKFVRELDVTLTYKPKIIFYVELRDDSSKINKVIHNKLINEYNGMNKEFVGDIYYNLESDNSLYYVINGDYYSNRALKSSSNKLNKFNYSLKTKNHYKYFYEDDYFHIR